jgi:hypothetical protein
MLEYKNLSSLLFEIINNNNYLNRNLSKGSIYLVSKNNYNIKR